MMKNVTNMAIPVFLLGLICAILVFFFTGAWLCADVDFAPYTCKENLMYLLWLWPLVILFGFSLMSWGLWKFYEKDD